MKKVVIWTITLLIVAASAAGMWYMRKNERQAATQQWAMAQAYEGEIRSLYNKRSGVEAQLAELDEAVSGAGLDLGTVMVMFAEPDARIVTEIAPAMKEYNYTGIIAVSDDSFPGDEGCMSAEDLQSLIRRGWELCITVTKETKPAALIQRMQESDLPLPVFAYFPTNDYGDSWRDALESLNLTAVIQRKAPDEEDEETWQIEAIGSYESRSVDALAESAAESKYLVLTVGYKNIYEMYTESNFRGMLATLQGYVSGGELAVANSKMAQQRYLERQDAIKLLEEDVQEQRNALNAELEDIQKQIGAVNDRYAGGAYNR